MTGFGAAESGVDRCVICFLIVIAVLAFIASWLPIVVPDFGSAQVTGAIASTSELAIFSRTKAGHQSGKG